MSQTINSRRQFMKAAATGLGGLSLPMLLQAQQENTGTPLSVVCVGGHPDDPESGCGGTLSLFANAGHRVTVIYLTTGEAGIPGKTHQEAAAIRKQEALAACKMLKATAVFAGQTDGDTVVNKAWIGKLQELVMAAQPDIVFTHWPADTHMDHQAASLLTMQVWMRAANPFQLYFFEVCAGEQTLLFQPTDYVDITGTQEQKRRAIYCHTSQDPAGIYACGHADMEQFRGRETGVKAAEAFVRLRGRSVGGQLQQMIRL